MSRLRHLLTLLARLLALTCLVLAFAQPYLPLEPSTATQPKTTVVIHLDNSFSMSRENEVSTLFESARQTAIQLVKSYGVEKKYILATNDLRPEHLRKQSSEQIIQHLQELKISESRKSLEEVQSRLEANLPKEEFENVEWVSLSDFQSNQFKNDTEFLAEELSPIGIPFVPNQLRNVSIDSIWFDTPIRSVNSADQLNIRLQNHGKKEKQVPVNLIINDEKLASISLSIAAETILDTAVSFTLSNTGIFDGLISLEDYPVTFDNQYFFSFQINENINLLEIGTGTTGQITSSSFAKLYKADSSISYTFTPVSNLDYGKFSTYDLIVLNDLISVSSGLSSELSKFISNGGSAIVVPSIDADIKTYNEFLAASKTNLTMAAIDTADQAINSLNLDASLFKEVFQEKPKNLNYPKSQSHFPLRITTKTQGEAVLSLANGEPFIYSVKSDGGRLTIFSSSLNAASSSLAKHALFVPIGINAALQSITSMPAAYDMSQNIAIPIAKINDELVNVAKDSFSFVPEIRQTAGATNLFLHDQISKAGHYQILINDSLVSSFGMNYPRLESQPEVMDENQLRSIFGDNLQTWDSDPERMSDQIIKHSAGIPLWQWFIGLTLLFLLIEMALIRLWKR